MRPPSLLLAVMIFAEDSGTRGEVGRVDSRADKAGNDSMLTAISSAKHYKRDPVKMTRVIFCNPI